ncbi:MAG: phosphate ABC transporter substrate-binding protein [Colwellia sp.]|nr:phosphate ABC transporter substrate-binding protein [Colwellia sp.]
MNIKKVNRMLVAVLLTSLASMTAYAEVVIIVNPSNTATLSDKDISRIFLGKLKSFSNGDKVVAVNLKFGSETRNEFEKKVLHKSSSQIKAYWSKLVFSGKGKPPPEMVSDKDVISLVASDSNVIAYVDSASVDDTVKILKTF